MKGTSLPKEIKTGAESAGQLGDRQVPILSFANVSRFFPVRRGFFAPKRQLVAVDDVSFELQKGESLGLVGESGCGKSTMGRLACGLLLPSSGQVSFAGRSLPEAGAGSWAAGRIQMVFQDPFSSLDPRMRVAESVAEPLLARGRKMRESLDLAEAMLATVGLQGMGDRYPHEFSGGQRQRIAVARSLMTRPDVIVCDEPVSALDASVQAQILNLLRQAAEDFGPAYLFISHDLAVVGFMCRHIMVMYLGQIVEDASREQLFDSPAHPYSQALLAARPAAVSLFGGNEGKGKKLPEALAGELPSPIDPPSGCRFHPRCPKAQAICSQEQPEWRQLAENWRVRCHFPLTTH